MEKFEFFYRPWSFYYLVHHFLYQLINLTCRLAALSFGQSQKSILRNSPPSDPADLVESILRGPLAHEVDYLI